MTKETYTPEDRKTVRDKNANKLYSRKRHSLTLEQIKNKYLKENKATA